MSVLQNGDTFPDITIDLVGGGRCTLPADLTGSFSVVLFNRGSWCPYCNAQLAAFARAADEFVGLPKSLSGTPAHAGARLGQVPENTPRRHA